MAQDGSKVAQAGVVALALLVPSGVGVALRSEAAAHPLLAFLLAVGYWLLLAVVAFAGKVFALLQGRWAERVALWADRAVHGRLSRYERRYLRYVEQVHCFSGARGLVTRGEQTPRMEDVFVDVSLRPTPLHEAGQGPLVGLDDTGTGTARMSLGDLIQAPDPVVLAVIGKPGTGKTTLLEHTAVQLARRRGRKSKGPRRGVPVVLFLRDHADAVAGDPDRPLVECVRSTLSDLAADEPPGWLEDQLDKGRCVVMLDGLDEVAREADRHLIVAWVEKQIALHPLNDWLLTSRPHGYESSPLDRAQVLQVRRFTGEQITAFLHRWYQAVERISTGRDDEAVDQRARAEADDLLSRLRDRPVLYDLAANPLLLTMIANVHKYRGALPGSRAELYAEICQVLLWRRQEAKRLAPTSGEVSGAKKEAVLRELAYLLMSHKTRDLLISVAESWLRPALERIGFPGAAQDFLDPVVSSGLLIEREIGVYAFAHQTFQEHLAAAYVLEHGRSDTLRAAVNDAWWRETTLLWAARADPTEIIDTCLDDGGLTALALAFDCAEEAATLAPATRRRLEDFRAQALRAPRDSAQRRLMTAVTLTRHLGESVRLTDDVQVCTRPVSRGLYRLFSTDHPEHAALLGAVPDLADGPDGFDDSVSDPGAADAPGVPDTDALGMTAAAAQALLQWANHLAADTAVYQLPRLEQFEEPSLRPLLPPGRALWAANPESARSTPVLWVPPGIDHPWTTTAARIRERHRVDSEPAVWDGLLRILTGAPEQAFLGYPAPTVRLAHTLAILRVLDRAVVVADKLVLNVDNSRPHYVEDTEFARTAAAEGARRNAWVLANGLSRAVGMAEALSPILSQDFSRDLAATHAVGRELDLTGAEELRHNLSRHVDRVSSEAGVLIRSLGLDFDIDSLSSPAQLLDVLRSRGWPPTLSPPVPGTEPALIVRTLAVPVLDLLPDPVGARATRRQRKERERETLPHPLDLCARHVGDEQASYTVPPDDVPGHIEALTGALAAPPTTGGEEEARLDVRVRELAARLAAYTPALLAEGTQAFPDATAMLRTVALGIATAADTTLGNPEAGDHARAVAAALTALQDREDGTQPPTETLMFLRA